ncbi:hypothetical protein Pcinc_037147 [Petrolisthes cinctipes]|uniref:C2H2-type domain-containing protein n=1 Tax=Petrolisthes cinctipes TaxID=88211 RepID=A0AAE1BT11_PETCI|nr:hypothetical protein Pcinc_037147 [Petrolisthes cinctipes]
MIELVVFTYLVPGRTRLEYLQSGNMTEASKKITYTSEFKLKVLDYYFKNGGDENFGLKKKTASHFNINKKTINRLLNNPDMVKRARKLVAKRIPPASVRTVAKPRPSTTKPPVKGSSKSSTGSRVGTSGSARSTNISSKLTNTMGQNSASSATSKAPTSSVSTNKSSGSSSAKSGSGVGSGAQTTTKSGTSKSRCTNQEVLELPEDPDYSLLKRSISASSNGVANIAKVLVSGTDEVRKMLLNECDMILECKVCRNLFRSLVNFLAHKRIYCQDEYASVRTLFHKDPVQGITTQSQTVIVEPTPPPEPPDWQPPPINPTSNPSQPNPSQPNPSQPNPSQPNPSQPNPSGSSQADPVSKTGIDSIAEMLASRKQQLSHATHTGSSQYYKRLEETNQVRNRLSQECSVVLEDISGVTSAQYQTFTPPTASTTPSVPITTMLDQVAQYSAGVTVAIDENGEVTKTARGDVTSMTLDDPASPSNLAEDLLCRLCNTRFATQKTLSVHQRSHHGLERCVYVCPICHTPFLSMWAVVKHLQRSHKKTKHQIERLRKVIRKNAHKKVVLPPGSGKKEGERKDGKGPDGDEEDEELEEEEGEDNEEEEMEEEENTNCEPTKMEVENKPSTTQKLLHSPAQSHQKSTTPIKSPTKGWRSKDGVRWSCNVCRKMFMSRAASLAHVATHIICDFEPRAELVSMETETAIDETSEKPQEESEQETTSSDSGNENPRTNRDRESDWEEEAGENQSFLFLTPPRKTKRKDPNSVQRISVEDEAGEGTSRECVENESEGSKASQAVKGTSGSDGIAKLDKSGNVDKTPQSSTVPPMGVSETQNVTSGLSLTNISKVLKNKVDCFASASVTGVTESLDATSSSSQKYDHNQVIKKKVDVRGSVTADSWHKKISKWVTDEVSRKTTSHSKPEENLTGTPTRVSGDSNFNSDDMEGELFPVLNPLFTCLETRYSSVSTKSPMASRSEADVHQSATELRLFEDCGDEESPDQVEAGTSQGCSSKGECRSDETDVKMESERKESEQQRSYKREKGSGKRYEEQKVFKGKKRKASNTEQKEERETPSEKNKNTECEKRNKKKYCDENVDIDDNSEKEGRNAESWNKEIDIKNKGKEKHCEEEEKDVVYKRNVVEIGDSNIKDETRMEFGKAREIEKNCETPETRMKHSENEGNGKEGERKGRTPTENAEVKEVDKCEKKEKKVTCKNKKEERHSDNETRLDDDDDEDSSTISSLENPHRKHGSSLVECGKTGTCENVGKCRENTGEQLASEFSKGNFKISGNSGCEMGNKQSQSQLLADTSAGVLELSCQSKGPAESTNNECAPSVIGTLEKVLSTKSGTVKNDDIDGKLTEDNITRDSQGQEDISGVHEQIFSKGTNEKSKEVKNEGEMDNLRFQEVEVKFKIEEQESVILPTDFEFKEVTVSEEFIDDESKDVKEEPISPGKGKTITSPPISSLQESGKSDQSRKEYIFKETEASVCQSSSNAQTKEDKNLGQLSIVPSTRFPLLSVDDMEYFQSLVGEVSKVKVPTTQQSKDATHSNPMLMTSPGTLPTHQTTWTPSYHTSDIGSVSPDLKKISFVSEKDAITTKKPMKLPQSTCITGLLPKFAMKPCPDSGHNLPSPADASQKTVSGDVRTNSSTAVQQSHPASQTSVPYMSTEKQLLKSLSIIEQENVSQSQLLTRDTSIPSQGNNKQQNVVVTQNISSSVDGVSKSQFLPDCTSLHSVVKNKNSSHVDTKAPNPILKDVSGSPSTKQDSSSEGKLEEKSEETTPNFPLNQSQTKQLPTSAADDSSVETCVRDYGTNPTYIDMNTKVTESVSEISALPIQAKAGNIKTYSLCSKGSTTKSYSVHMPLVQETSKEAVYSSNEIKPILGALKTSKQGKSFSLKQGECSTTFVNKVCVSGTSGSNSECERNIEVNVDDDISTSKSVVKTSKRLLLSEVPVESVTEDNQSESTLDVMPFCIQKDVDTQRVSGSEDIHVREAKKSERQTCQRRELKETNKSTGSGSHDEIPSRFKHTEIKLKTVSIRKESATAHISPLSSVSTNTCQGASSTMSSDSQATPLERLGEQSHLQGHKDDRKISNRDTHLRIPSHRSTSQVSRTEVGSIEDEASCSTTLECSYNKTLQKGDIDITKTTPCEEKLSSLFMSIKRPREDRDSGPTEETEVAKRVKMIETATCIKPRVPQKSQKVFQMQKTDESQPCTSFNPEEEKEEDQFTMCTSDKEQDMLRLFTIVKENEQEEEIVTGNTYVTKGKVHSKKSSWEESESSLGINTSTMESIELESDEATTSNSSMDSNRTVILTDPTARDQSHTQPSKDNKVGESSDGLDHTTGNTSMACSTYHTKSKKSAHCPLKKVKSVYYLYRQREGGLDMVAMPSERLEDSIVEENVIDTEDVLHDHTTFGGLSYDYDLH